jgi:hypothetical protein
MTAVSHLAVLAIVALVASTLGGCHRILICRLLVIGTIVMASLVEGSLFTVAKKESV